MTDQGDRYQLWGRRVPYRPDNEIALFAELSITSDQLIVSLLTNPFGPLRCSTEIWEHTIHELEVLSACLRCAAAGPFPYPIAVETPDSRIGATGRLFLAVDMEIGYSLERPSEARARFFCSSNIWDLRDRKLGVALGIAVSGAFAEVVMEPPNALELADWLDHHTKTWSLGLSL